MRRKTIKNKKNKRIGLPVKVKKKVAASTRSLQPGGQVAQVKKRKVIKKKEPLRNITKDNKKEKENDYDEIINNYRVKVEREKSLIMWSGITFFMVLIISCWIYNTKIEFQRISRESASVPNFEINELSDQISNKINEIEEKIESIEEDTNTETNADTNTETEATKSEEETIEELKNAIEQVEVLENK